jgi:hypothetical protein
MIRKNRLNKQQFVNKSPCSVRQRLSIQSCFIPAYLFGMHIEWRVKKYDENRNHKDQLESFSRSRAIRQRARIDLTSKREGRGLTVGLSSATSAKLFQIHEGGRGYVEHTVRVLR